MYKKLKYFNNLIKFVGINFSIFFINFSFAQNIDTIEQIKKNNIINIGYEQSVPFAYHTIDKSLIGYHIDICYNVAVRIKKELNLTNAKIEFINTENKSKTELIQTNKIDFDCGLNLATPDNLQQFTFHFPTFISSINVFSKKSSNLNNIEDLKNKKIVIVENSIESLIFKNINEKLKLQSQTIFSTNTTTAFIDFNNKKTDAIIVNNTLSFNEYLKMTNFEDYKYSVYSLKEQPISIINNKNQANFSKLINSELHKMYKSGEIAYLYQKWFQRDLIDYNKNLNKELSVSMQDIFRNPLPIY